MKLVAILALAGLALAGCTQQQATSAGPPPTTSTTDNTVWVPVTGTETPTTTTTAQAVVAPKPPVAPTGYGPFNYQTPPHPPAGGFAINMAAPAGWNRSQDGDKTDFRDPTGQLLVQFEDVPAGRPVPANVTSAFVVGLLSQRAQATQGEYANYHQIALGPVAIGPYDIPGGQWQFTFTANGVLRQVTVLGMIWGSDLVTVYVSGPQQFSSILASIVAQERGMIDIAG